MRTVIVLAILAIACAIEQVEYEDGPVNEPNSVEKPKKPKVQFFSLLT